jgi:hypothetical protein
VFYSDGFFPIVCMVDDMIMPWQQHTGSWSYFSKRKNLCPFLVA